jgi:hypothetical protein
MKLVRFTDHTGSPVYINPEMTTSVGKNPPHHDMTQIRTVGDEWWTVKESLTDVVRALEDCALPATLECYGGAD